MSALDEFPLDSTVAVLIGCSRTTATLKTRRNSPRKARLRPDAEA